MRNRDEARDASYDHQLASRLRAVLGLFGSRREASQVAGRSEDSLANYASGKTEPPFPAVVKLASHVGVSLTWMATGQGPMMAAECGVTAEPVPAGHTLDPDLLANCMRAADKALTEVKLRVTVEQEAKMVAILYNDMLASTPEDIDRYAELERQRQRIRAEGANLSDEKRQKAS